MENFSVEVILADLLEKCQMLLSDLVRMISTLSFVREYKLVEVRSCKPKNAWGQRLLLQLGRGCFAAVVAGLQLNFINKLHYKLS